MLCNLALLGHGIPLISHFADVLNKIAIVAWGIYRPETSTLQPCQLSVKNSLKNFLKFVKNCMGCLYGSLDKCHRQSDFGRFHSNKIWNFHLRLDILDRRLERLLLFTNVWHFGLHLVHSNHFLIILVRSQIFCFLHILQYILGPKLFFVTG